MSIMMLSFVCGGLWNLPWAEESYLKASYVIAMSSELAGEEGETLLHVLNEPHNQEGNKEALRYFKVCSVTQQDSCCFVDEKL